MKSKIHSLAKHLLVLMLVSGFSFNLAAQRCDNPPDCILNPSFSGTQNGNLNPGFQTVPDWYYSHGTPSVNLTAGVGGTGSIWMWSYSSRGEGIYSCFNFQQSHTYRICLWVQSTNAINLGNLNIFAATGLAQPAYPAASTPIPTPTTSELIDNSFVNNFGPAWTQLVIDYTPNANYNQLWIYPFMANGPINNQQYELRVSNVNIIEMELPVGISVPCGDPLVLKGPSQSCATGKWIAPDGTPLGVGTVVIPNADPSMNGIYQMVVSVGDCEYTLERQVLVEECNCDEFEASFEVSGTKQPITFTETSTGPGTSVAWFWDFGDGNTSNLQNPTHTYSQPGVYEVCLTVIRRVGNQTCCKRICKEIEVGEPPRESVTPSTGFKYNPVPSFNTAIKFTDISVNEGVFKEYKWDFGDGIVSGQQHPAHVYAKEGVYKVCLTVTNNIFDANGTLVERVENEYCDEVNVGPSVYDINKGEVNVMPNPSTGQAIVTVENIPNPKVLVRSITGVEVGKVETMGANQYKVNLESLPTGVYIVEVQSEFGSKTVKLIKE